MEKRKGERKRAAQGEREESQVRREGQRVEQKGGKGTVVKRKVQRTSSVHGGSHTHIVAKMIVEKTGEENRKGYQR